MDASIRVAEVPARRGASWLSQAFGLFARKPIAWIALCAGWIIITLGLHAGVFGTLLVQRMLAGRPPKAGQEHYVDATLVRFGKPRDLSFLPHKKGVVKTKAPEEAIKVARDLNQLPKIDSVRMYPDRDPDTFDPLGTITTLDPGAAAEVPAGTKSVWIEPARGIAEQFVTTVIDPDTHLAVPFTVPRETLRYRFFATAGRFSKQTTSSEPDPGFVPKGPIHIESEYQLPGRDQIDVDGEGHAIVTIWVVVRDDRGGETWQERHLRITP